MLEPKAIEIGAALGIGAGLLGTKLLKQAFPNIDPSLITENEVSLHNYAYLHGVSLINYLYNSFYRETYGSGGVITARSEGLKNAFEKVSNKLKDING